MSKRVSKSLCTVMAVIAIITGWQAQYKANPDSLPVEVKQVMTSKAGNHLRFSQKAFEIIGDAESCRRDAYQCPARVWTAGIGHTGAGVKPNLKDIPLETIALWFISDTMEAQNCIEHNLERPPLKKLPQGVFDAIGSLIFNTGCKNIINSTLAKFIKAGEYIKACYQLPRWNKAAGKEQPGLVIRRGKELAVCLSPN